MASRRSPTSCANAPTCAGPCQCSSPTRHARQTRSPSELRASRSPIRTTGEEWEAEVEEEEAAAVDRSRGDGPPCIVETRLPNVYVDTKVHKGLGEDSKGTSVSKAKVRLWLILLLIATAYYFSVCLVCTTTIFVITSEKEVMTKFRSRNSAKCCTCVSHVDQNKQVQACPRRPPRSGRGPSTLCEQCQVMGRVCNVASPLDWHECFKLQLSVFIFLS